MKDTITFSSFCEQIGITEDQGQALINEAQDQVDFCSIVSKRYATELTLRQAQEIYETAPMGHGPMIKNRKIRVGDFWLTEKDLYHRITNKLSTGQFAKIVKAIERDLFIERYEKESGNTVQRLDKAIIDSRGHYVDTFTVKLAQLYHSHNQRKE